MIMYYCLLIFCCPEVVTIFVSISFVFMYTYLSFVYRYSTDLNTFSKLLNTFDKISVLLLLRNFTFSFFNLLVPNQISISLDQLLWSASLMSSWVLFSTSLELPFILSSVLDIFGYLDPVLSFFLVYSFI